MRGICWIRRDEEKDEMIEMTEMVLLEAGEDQDASETVNPVLDLDEVIRMLNLVGGGNLNLNFVPT